MKRIALFAVMIALSAMFVMPERSIGADINTVKVTTLQNGGKLIRIQQLVKGTATVTSPAFSLDGFLENTTSYPVKVCYSVDTSNQNAGVEIDSVGSILQYTNDQTANTTTYLAADTLSLTLGTTAYTATTLDLNSHKGGYWQWKTTGKGANTAALVTIDMYLYRRDH